MYGIDVRRHGSKRTGGTNVLRTAGGPAFALTILGDILKGVLPVVIMHLLFTGPEEIGPALAVLGVLLGNNWSIIVALLPPARRDAAPQAPAGGNLTDRARAFFARAKGGAGVTATAGAAITLYWPPVAILLVIGISILVILRYASVASMTVAILYPIAMTFFYVTGAAAGVAGPVPLVYVIVSFLVGLIVLYVHIPNMKKLRAGTESRFGQRLTPKPAPGRVKK